jgi:uncharacterized membrane protein YuzA (DUF378 family)
MGKPAQVRRHIDRFPKETVMATHATTIDRRQSPERRAALREMHHSVMNAVDYIAMALLIIGGLNWAMVGLFDIDVIASVFGPRSAGTRLLYILAGAAALYSIYMSAKLSTKR